MPGDAPAAKRMGRCVRRLTAARAAGRPAPPAFAHRHHGDLATIGGKSAVVVLDRVRLTGFVGGAFWNFAHVWYLIWYFIGSRGRVVVGSEWLWSHLSFRRGVRPIVGERTPAAEACASNAPTEQKTPRRRA